MIGADRFSADSADTPFLQALRPRAAAAGVAMRGHLPHAGVLAAMQRAAIVCVPSRWPEPFGLAALEAMACGVPVVASAVGGLLDTVVSGVTGLFAHPRDPRSIADATNKLLGDERRRHAMGRAGAERVRHCYSWQRIAELTEHSYRRALQASAARSDVAAWR